MNASSDVIEILFKPFNMDGPHNGDPTTGHGMNETALAQILTNLETSMTNA
jgi:hypothetical protein